MSRDRRARRVVAAALAIPLVATSAGAASAGTTSPSDDRAGVFVRSAHVDNRLFTLSPGTQYVYDGTVVDEEGTHAHRVVFTVTDLVKVVDGVRTVVVWDLDFDNGELAEAELALDAQDAAGNVWTLGEYPEEYENGGFAGAPSTWVSGLRRAEGGILVPGRPRVGQRFVEGRALSVEFFDVGKVVRRHVHTCVPVGCFDDVVVVDEWSPLAPEDGHQLKYYAPGVGLVRIGAVGGGAQEVLTLSRVVHLGAAALASARAQALRLDRRGHRYSGVWSRTAAAHRR